VYKRAERSNKINILTRIVYLNTVMNNDKKYKIKTIIEKRFIIYIINYTFASFVR
jgi:hypothetical protein